MVLNTEVSGMNFSACLKFLQQVNGMSITTVSDVIYTLTSVR